MTMATHRFTGGTRSLVLGAVLGALGAGPALAGDLPDRIVVTAYGGIWAESVRNNYVPCFEEKTGVRVEVMTGESSEWLNRVRAAPDNSPIDVITLSELDSLRAAREGLLDRMSLDTVPNLAQIPPQFHEPWDSHGVSGTFGGLGVMYNSEAIQDPPGSWVELVDGIIEGRYGRKVVWPSGTYTWGPAFIWFLAQQYGGDMDTAFEKIKAMQPNVLRFWTTPVEALNLFATREADILIYWDGRAHAFMNDGNDWAKFYIPDNKAVVSLVLFSKVKSAHPVVWEYINCMLSPEGQLGNSTVMRYPGTNTTVEYPEELAREFTPFDAVVVPPYAEIIDLIPEWIERWNREMR